MRVYCRLKEIMRVRSMSVVELHRLAGVGGASAITRLRQDNLQRAGDASRWRRRSARALGLSFSELFELIPEDIGLRSPHGPRADHPLRLALDVRVAVRQCRR